MEFNDGLQSAIHAMGDTSRDKLASSRYSGARLEEAEIQNIYESNWMGKRLVEIPAKDAIRNWRIWQCCPKQMTSIERTEKRLDVQGKVLWCKILARLLGGAAIFIGTGDADVSKPLEPSRLGRDGLRYLTVIPKTSLTVGDLEDRVTEPNYGKAAYYEMQNGQKTIRIHPSRMVVMVGAPHVDEWNVVGASRGWGDSVIQASYQTLKRSDATDENVAGLIFEANINVFKIPDLLARVGDPTEERLLVERFLLASRQKGLHGDLIIDSEEEFTRNAASFSNLDNIMERFAILVGATQGIPASKFLGQSPKGLAGNSENELNNYYDEIKTVQSLEIEPAMRVLDECILYSALGNRPEELAYIWAPLSQPSAKEIAETGEKFANLVRTLVDSGLYEAAELREAATNQLVNLDILPNLGDVTTTTQAPLDNDDMIVGETYGFDGFGEKAPEGSN